MDFIVQAVVGQVIQGRILFSRRETTNDQRERWQDEIASDISRMRKYVRSGGAV